MRTRVSHVRPPPALRISSLSPPLSPVNRDCLEPQAGRRRGIPGVCNSSAVPLSNCPKTGAPLTPGSFFWTGRRCCVRPGRRRSSTEDASGTDPDGGKPAQTGTSNGYGIRADLPGGPPTCRPMHNFSTSHWQTSRRANPPQFTFNKEGYSGISFTIVALV